MHNFLRFLVYALTGDAIRNPEKYQYYFNRVKNEAVCKYRNVKEKLKFKKPDLATAKTKAKSTGKTLGVMAVLAAFIAAILPVFIVIFIALLIGYFSWTKK